MSDRRAFWTESLDLDEQPKTADLPLREQEAPALTDKYLNAAIERLKSGAPLPVVAGPLFTVEQAEWIAELLRAAEVRGAVAERKRVERVAFALAAEYEPGGERTGVAELLRRLETPP